MEDRRTTNKRRLWLDCAQLVVALFVPLTIIAYTVMQNNTEISIARQNRLQDLQIADERHQQSTILSQDEQEEATLVQYFDSLGKLLEKDENLENLTNIARFKTLTALAQLKSKRKGFLIRSLIENKLIIMKMGQNASLDLSLADLTGLDLTNKMLVKNEINCAVLSRTTLTNASFRGMALPGSTFIQATLINSDFSSSQSYPWSCGDGNLFGVNFDGAVLNDSIFDNAHYEKSTFAGSSLTGARMRHFRCVDCTFYEATMNSMDLSGAEFSSRAKQLSTYQSVNMSSTLLYQTTFSGIDLSQAKLIMVNATETTFKNSRLTVASLRNSSFIQTIISNSSFEKAFLRGSSWYQAKISYTSFLEADMTYVNFINSECYYCLFNQTRLTGTSFANSSLDGSDFTQADVTDQQLSVARSLQGVILPNGTIFQSMKNTNL